MKKIFLLIFLLPCLVYSQHGVNAVFKSVKIVEQLSGVIEYDQINVSLDAASSMTSDTLWFYENNHQIAMTLDSIFVRATTDDQDVNLVKSGRYGGSIAVIDAITADVNGAGEVFTKTETTLTTGTLAAGEKIGMTKPTTASDNISISIYYHYTKQVR